MSTSELTVSTITSGHSAPIRDGFRQGRATSSHRHSRVQPVVDFVIVACGLSAAHVMLLNKTVGLEHWRSPMVIAGASLIVVALFAQLGTYSPPAAPMNILETEKLVRGMSFTMAIAAASCMYAQVRVSALASSLTIAVMVILVVQRDASHWLTRWNRRPGHGATRVLVYGSQHYLQFTKLFINNPNLRKVCVGFVDDGSGPIPVCAREERKPLGSWSDIERIAKEHTAAEVVVAASSVSEEKLADIALECEHLNLCLSVAVNGLSRYGSYCRYELLGNMPVAKCGATGETSGNLLLKRAIDLVGAAALLVLLSPLYVLAALLIRLDSKGPVFFRHERIGKEGTRFYLWKFRSMRADSFPYERSPASDSDSRLTRVGRVLRRLSIDELPQLINVLKGDMSLVGPRPEMPFIVERYGPLERRRLKLKPGITGLWQISPARAMPIHENMEFDLFYIAHQNIFLDCAILLRTLTAVIRGVGAT